MRTYWLWLLSVTLVGACVVAACGGSPATPPPPPPPTINPLPDLVVADILLKPKPANYPDDVIVNTVVRNDGADATVGFIVWCSFSCNGSPTYFSGMQMTNGLGAGQSATLGDDSLLSLSSCSFTSQREFTCTVDSENLVTESNESNNELTETLLTDR